eukprot:357811-Chlamydomonas_euryale.AAC.16
MAAQSTREAQSRHCHRCSESIFQSQRPRSGFRTSRRPPCCCRNKNKRAHTTGRPSSQLHPAHVTPAPPPSPHPPLKASARRVDSARVAALLCVVLCVTIAAAAAQVVVEGAEPAVVSALDAHQVCVARLLKRDERVHGVLGAVGAGHLPCV